MSKYKEIAGNTLLFAIATFFSRILGFVREVVISSIYGLGKTTDAFFLAYTIPNLIRQLLGEGALHNSFIPIYEDVKVLKDKKKKKEFLDVVFTFLLFSLLFLSVLGIFISPLLIRCFAPGFSQNPYIYGEAVKILRILFPYMLFISLTAFYGAILNSCGEFFFPALTPMWLNLSMIVFAIFFWKIIGIYALAIGVVIGGIFQFLSLFYFIRKIGISFSLNFNFKNRYFKKVVSLVGKSVLAVIVTQLNIVIDRIFASFLVVGSISALYYANRLMQFPIGVFGVALSSVFFPHISKTESVKNWKEFKEYTSLGIKSIGIALLPFSFYLILFSKNVVNLVYRHGVFTAYNAHMTSLALKYYSIGIFFFSVNNLLNRVFYSTKDGKTPVIVNALSVLLNIGLNFLLVSFMSYRGLALATSISAIFNFLLLFYLLLKKGYIEKLGDYIIFFSKVSGVCVIITGVTFLLMMGDHFWYNFVIPSFLFFVFYFILLYIIGVSEIKMLVSLIKRGV